MFKILHRLYILGWVVGLLGGAVWLYARAGVSEPVEDWYDVWQNTHGTPSTALGHLQGTVIRVMNGNTFVVRTPDHQAYSIGLVGTVAPLPGGHGPNQSSAVEHSRARLSELILSNEVEIAVVSMDAQHRGLGVVHSGMTNVNAAMIRSGLVEFKPEYAKGLPALDQYALFRADRLGKERSAR